jgi:urease alpha subunit
LALPWATKVPPADTDLLIEVEKTTLLAAGACGEESRVGGSKTVDSMASRKNAFEGAVDCVMTSDLDRWGIVRRTLAYEDVHRGHRQGGQPRLRAAGRGASSSAPAPEIIVRKASRHHQAASDSHIRYLPAAIEPDGVTT